MGRSEGRQRKRKYKDWPRQGNEEEEKKRDLPMGACPGAAGRGPWWRGGTAEGEADFSAILLYLTHRRL